MTRTLTPELRQEILNSFDSKIAELKTCERTGLITEQIFIMEVEKELIKKTARWLSNTIL